MEIIPFDWQRMFLGTESLEILLEIAFRTAFLYLYTILITRLVGRRRSLGKLTPLEFILVIVLGPAAGGGMIYPEVPLLHSMAVITVLGLLAKLGASLSSRYPSVHHFFEGEPLLIIKDGKILTEELSKENITKREVYRELRMSGYKDPSAIEEAYFEPSGQISLIPFKKS